MQQKLDNSALDQLFYRARTYGTTAESWLSKPVSDAQLQQIWDMSRMGPTSANCSPMRVVFVRSPEAKAKLKPALDASNVDKTMSAPVTAIIATDFAFYNKLPFLFPHVDAKPWFEGKPHSDEVAFRNACLQGAYLIIAARALGLDCGPMSGFNNTQVDTTFFTGTAIRSNFLVNLGYGNPSTLFPRSPRLSFDEACRID
jgi:3-hydroxypropanoate dehydrogenase